MILLVHIAVALASLVHTTFLYLHPSRNRLAVAYSLVALTIGSGTYLIWSTQTHILEACITGLLYLSAVAIAIVAARRKLATATNKIIQS